MQYDSVNNFVERRKFYNQTLMNQTEDRSTYGMPHLTCSVCSWHGISMANNLIRGIGSVVTIYPTSRNFQFGMDILSKSDSEMIRDDWLQVGIDLQKSLDTHSKEIVHHECKV